MKVGEVFPTNTSGDLTIKEYGGCFSVVVEFKDTGFTITTSSDQIRKGKVKDRLKKTLCGVGFLGSKIPYQEYAYTVWANMIKRCYDEKVQAIHPTYIGCSVCAEWHEFRVFYLWFADNHKTGYEIDKDTKVKGNRVYGPDTCAFITTEENMQAAFEKTYEFINPDGKLQVIVNLAKFCRENSLHYSNMFKVLAGDRNTHKGWKKPINKEDLKCQ